MKITVDDLKPGMLVNITLRIKGEKASTELRCLVTREKRYFGQNGRGGMDQGSPTYIEYHLNKVEYSTVRDLKFHFNPNLTPHLKLDGTGTWSSNPYDILEITYVGMMKSLVLWEYNSDLSERFGESFESAFIEKIKQKVKGVLTEEELNVLLSIGGK